jgi:hypothetical protein
MHGKFIGSEALPARRRNDFPPNDCRRILPASSSKRLAEIRYLLCKFIAAGREMRLHIEKVFLLPRTTGSTDSYYRTSVRDGRCLLKSCSFLASLASHFLEASARRSTS